MHSDIPDYCNADFVGRPALGVVLSTFAQAGS